MKYLILTDHLVRRNYRFLVICSQRYSVLMLPCNCGASFPRLTWLSLSNGKLDFGMEQPDYCKNSLLGLSYFNTGSSKRPRAVASNLPVSTLI